MENAKQRVEQALKSCRAIYDNLVHGFEHIDEIRQMVGKIIQGKDVLDIGCGMEGGMCNFSLSLGARSYTGIDIELYHIIRSRSLFPQGKFILDDPIYVIQNWDKPQVVLSSAFFDTTIIRDLSYADKLIKVISDKTPKGSHTFHAAFNFYEDFNARFEQNGFTLSDKFCDFCVYERK